MAANGISTLATKQARQAAKLAAAATKRAATGRPSTLDITKLPTQFLGNTIVDNPNADGLVQGRPWSAVPLGVVDTLGFFENQLIGGTYMTFDETILGIRVQSIVTNFNGNPTNGSYIKINGTLIAGDRFGTAPDGTNTTGAPFQMTRGHTIVVIDPVTGATRSGWPRGYDTYGNPSLCTNMRNDLAALATGDVVAIGTYDATSCTSDLRYALTTYFGDTAYTNTWLQVRISHMFLGKRL